MAADLTPIFSSLLGQQELVIADVGAAYGLPLHLRALDSVATVLFFEPHPERAKELRDMYAARGLGARVRVSTSALASTNGTRTLYVTNAPTGSSLLRPGSDEATDRGDPEYFYPLRETQVHTRRMEDVLAEEGLERVDFVKLDVQGAELEVLRGLGEQRVGTLLGVELEIGFPGAYVEQPGYAELQSYLESHGLALFDLKPVRGHRYLPKARKGYAEDVFGVTADAPSLSQRLWEADAVYFRSAKQLLAQRDAQALRRLLLLYCAYGFFVEAHHLVTQAHAASIFPADERTRLANDVIAWHRRGRYHFTDSAAWRGLSARLGALTDRVTRRIFRRRLPGWLDQ